MESRFKFVGTVSHNLDAAYTKVVNFIYSDKVIVRSPQQNELAIITVGRSHFCKSCVGQMEDQSFNSTISQAVINICVPVKLVIRSRAAEQGE